MIDHGATTCWEMYPNFKEGRTKKDVLTRSHCHAWSAGPAYFLGTEVLGIRKAATGWQRVTIAPQPVGVAWAKGSVPLPDQGRIDVSWSFNEIDRQLNISVKHPDSIQVDILIPDGYTGHIQVVKLQGIGV